MAFEAGAIMGKVGLDLSPMRKAVDESISQAKKMKSGVEDAANNMKAGIAVEGLTTDVNKIKSLGTEAGKGFFDNLAAQAKRLRRDDRLSGEMALAGFAGRGASGFLDFGLSKLGIGAPAIAVQGLALAVNQTFDGLDKVKQQIRDGNAEWEQAPLIIAKGLPIIGEISSAIEKTYNWLTGVGDIIEEDARKMKGMADAMNSGAEFTRSIRDGLKASFDDVANLERQILILQRTIKGDARSANYLGAYGDAESQLNQQKTLLDNFKKNEAVFKSKYVADLKITMPDPKEIRRLQEITSNTDANSGEASYDTRMRFQNAEKRLKELLSDKQIYETRNQQAQTDFDAAIENMTASYNKAVREIGAIPNLADELFKSRSPEQNALKQINDQIRTLGMDSQEALIQRLRAMPGVDENIVSQVEDAIQKLNDLTQAMQEPEILQQINQGMKDVADEAARLDAIDVWRNQTEEAERYAKMLEGIQAPEEKFAAGLTDINKGIALKFISPDDGEKLVEGLKSQIYGGILDGIASPLDRFNKQMDVIQGALAFGAIDSSQFDKATAKARQDAFGADQIPKLIRAGSAEAQALRVGDGENSQIGIAKQQLGKLGDIEKVLSQIADKPATPGTDFPGI